MVPGAARWFDPLSWERVLWQARPARASLARLRGERYALTDLRLVRHVSGNIEELLLQDAAALRLRRHWIDRLGGWCTLCLEGANGRAIELRALPVGQALELVLQVLAHAPSSIRLESSVVPLALDPPRPLRSGLLAAIVVPLALAVVVAGRLQGNELSILYPPDDAIVPGGVKRDRAQIEAFMEQEVMPFARDVLGPIVGGADRVTCETCHGPDGRRRGWNMPGVSELPYPRVRSSGLERFGDPDDPQVRNAVYADLAQDDRQATAGYMRQVVMPGMARLLRRPAYDFTKPYAQNRRDFALGCYHCHKVQ
jgi:hypothetical protein